MTIKAILVAVCIILTFSLLYFVLKARRLTRQRDNSNASLSQFRHVLKPRHDNLVMDSKYGHIIRMTDDGYTRYYVLPDGVTLHKMQRHDIASVPGVKAVEMLDGLDGILCVRGTTPERYLNPVNRQQEDVIDTMVATFAGRVDLNQIFLDVARQQRQQAEQRA